MALDIFTKKHYSRTINKFFMNGGEKGFDDSSLDLFEELYSTLGRDDSMVEEFYWTAYECSLYEDMDEAYASGARALEWLKHIKDKECITC